MRDVSQSLKRRPGCSLHATGRGTIRLVPAVLPGSKHWLTTPFNRFATGRERFALQGFPVHGRQYKSLVEQADNKLLQDMAGNAMSGGVIWGVCISALISLDWNRQEGGVISTTDDAMLAMDALLASVGK